MVMTRSRERDKAAGRVDWVLCDSCRAMVYRPQLERDLLVCPECGKHHQVTAPARIQQLLDPGTIHILSFPVAARDPLGFVDRVPYAQRLAEMRRRTGLADAVVCARGAIEGHPVIAAVMDFGFLGGSLGGAAGELITRAAETALAERTPLLIVTASGGARMQEGTIALMQMAKTSQALGQLDAAGILTISLITDPTYGGVAASFASLCDVIIAEPGARMGFAGRRVIEQTVRQVLPPEFQTADFLLRHGQADGICARSELRPMLARVLCTATRDARAAQPAACGDLPDPSITDFRQLRPADPMAALRRARDLGRPTTLDYVSYLLDDFQELHGDRLGADCPAIVGGVGRLGEIQVLVVGHQKGHDAADAAARNYGMPSPAGYRKAARLMRLAAKLGLPVITFIDTPGAYPGADAEEQGQAAAIAENLRLMAGLTVPVVAVITGEGGSGGALALAVADRVLMFEGSVYSVISPEGCAAILWRDKAATADAAKALRIDARHLLRLGIVDGVIPEPDGGAQADHLTAAEELRAGLSSAMRQLCSMDPTRLLIERHARFRRFASCGEPRVSQLEDTSDHG
jgi:acyl-CoA carboxylase subunit beta